MKKTFCVLISIFLLTLMPTTAYANSSKAAFIVPGLSFENGIAYCTTVISAEDGDEIRAVIRLWYKGDRIRMWYASDTSYLVLDRTYDISDYGIGTYELTVDYTINNEERPQISISRAYWGN